MGGGNFVTQSAATNFHQFWKRKLLARGETVSMFKVVTAAEKAAIEAADAHWKRPSDDFIAQAEICGAKYNTSSGFFELNTLVDITTSQMRDIITYGKTTFVVPGEGCRPVRTNWVSIDFDAIAGNSSVRASFRQNQLLEVLVIGSSTEFTIRPSTFDYFCFRCHNLRKVLGWVSLINYPATEANEHIPQRNPFAECENLEVLNLFGLKTNIILGTLKSLNLTSLQFLVNNAANTSPVIVSLHADAYARLTGALITQAAEKQITFATS